MYNYAGMMKQFHANHLKELAQWINDVEQDPRWADRVDKTECKYCFYHPPKGAFQAITTSDCRDCKIEMTFSDSITDKYCKNCAIKNNVCAHCGTEMD